MRATDDIVVVGDVGGDGQSELLPPDQVEVAPVNQHNLNQAPRMFKFPDNKKLKRWKPYIQRLMQLHIIVRDGSTWSVACVDRLMRCT